MDKDKNAKIIVEKSLSNSIRAYSLSLLVNLKVGLAWRRVKL